LEWRLARGADALAAHDLRHLRRAARPRPPAVRAVPARALGRAAPIIRPRRPGGVIMSRGRGRPPIPAAARMKAYTVRLTRHEYDRLHARARLAGLTFSGLLRQIVRARIRRHGGEARP
jgi:hypothetical protein